MGKFKRDRVEDRKSDERGRVIVKVFLSGEGHRNVKGNMFVTIPVADATVGEVAKAIENALFGKS